MSEYLPLYGELLIGRCVNCDHWRGEHHGLSKNDHDMVCPSGGAAFQRPDESGRQRADDL